MKAQTDNTENNKKKYFIDNSAFYFIPNQMKINLGSNKASRYSKSSFFVVSCHHYSNMLDELVQIPDRSVHNVALAYNLQR